MQQNYSREALLRFLSTLGERGLANQNTAEGLRVAVSKLLADLSPEEEADVRKVDVETAVHRHHNRNPGQISPKSLAEYQKRVALAIRHYVSFTENPTSFRPIGRGAGKRATGEKREGKSDTGRGSASAIETPKTDLKTLDPIPAQPASLALSYPLRGDFLAQVVVPRDMKGDEARRLGAFIMTLASDFMPEA